MLDLATSTPSVKARYLAVALRNVRLRAAEFNPDQARDEHGQWTSGGGNEGVVFHGTPRANLDSILANGINPVEYQGSRHTVLIPGKVAFVTTSLKEAQEWSVNNPDTVHGVVLEIHVPPGEQLIRGAGNTLAKDAVIPPSWIKSVHARVDAKGKFITPRRGQPVVKTAWRVIKTLAGANGEVLFLVVDLGGDAVRTLGGPGSGNTGSRALGDVVGHEFHGNQWTEGAGYEIDKSSVTRTKGASYFDVKITDEKHAASGRVFHVEKRTQRDKPVFNADGGTDYYPSIQRAIDEAVKYGTKGRNLGGPGSGNFGHSGRPGEVGGSGPDFTFDPADGAMRLDKMAVVRAELKEPPATKRVDPDNLYRKWDGLPVTLDQAQAIADAVTSEMGQGSGRVTVKFVSEISTATDYKTRGDYGWGVINLSSGKGGYEHPGQTVGVLLHELSHWTQDAFGVSGGGQHRQGFERAERVTWNAFVRTRKGKEHRGASAAPSAGATLLLHHIVGRLAAFNPDQERDEAGKWTDGGAANKREHVKSSSGVYELGQIVHGEVRSVRIPEDELGVTQHGDVLGQLVAGPQRFRFTEGEIQWNEPPSADDYFAVGDHYARQYGEVTHTVFDGDMDFEPLPEPRPRGAAFNPDQERDETGKWTAGGGSGDSEAAHQTELAAAQTNPLAHPQFVLGSGRDAPAVQRYVAAYGQEFRSAPLPADIERGNPKECYKNASLLVMEHPELTYAEGFAQSDKTGDLVFQHAWAVTADGTVVDPTWDRPENGRYFGVKYERGAYLKYLYTAKIYGVLGSTTKNVQRATETGGAGLRALGGPGSGNFGHAGRPGEVGGSAPDGGVQIGRPVSDYPPSFAAGRDTRERFSDGKGHYTPERTALHNEIIQKALRGTTPVANPTATILGGAPGVGKSTIVKAEGIGAENTVSVSVDDIRNDLPEYAAGADGKRPASIATTHEEASDISAKLIRAAADGHRNLVLDGTGDSSVEKLGGKVAVLRAQGAAVEAVYVTTSFETAMARAAARAEKIGRQVAPTAAREMHAAVSRVFPEAVRQGLFDHAKLFDSSGRTPVLVASAVRRTLTVHNQALWDAFLAKVN